MPASVGAVINRLAGKLAAEGSGFGNVRAANRIFVKFSSPWRFLRRLLRRLPLAKGARCRGAKLFHDTGENSPCHPRNQKRDNQLEECAKHGGLSSFLNWGRFLNIPSSHSTAIYFFFFVDVWGMFTFVSTFSPIACSMALASAACAPFGCNSRYFFRAGAVSGG